MTIALESEPHIYVITKRRLLHTEIERILDILRYKLNEYRVKFCIINYISDIIWLSLNRIIVTDDNIDNIIDHYRKHINEIHDHLSLFDDPDIPQQFLLLKQYVMNIFKLIPPKYIVEFVNLN